MDFSEGKGAATLNIKAVVFQDGGKLPLAIGALTL